MAFLCILMHLLKTNIPLAYQECCPWCMCKVCSSLGQKWGNERAITGINIILTCSFLPKYDKLVFLFRLLFRTAWVVSQALMVRNKLGFDQQDDAYLNKACYKWETVHSFFKVHSYLSAPVGVKCIWANLKVPSSSYLATVFFQYFDPFKSGPISR